jgi:hypothetical protein
MPYRRRDLLVYVAIGIVGLLSAVAVFNDLTGHPERKAVAVFHEWEKDVKRGGTGSGYWHYKDEAEHFFAVRSCEILSVYPAVSDREHANIVARIESSNQGGMPLVSDWIFAMQKTSDGWKIDYLTQK